MSEYANNMEREFSWEDVIANDSEFELLPEGDYNIRVQKGERGRYPGGDKRPPCNMALLSIEVFTGQRRATLDHRLYLHSRCEGLLCEFFTAIGQRKHGEALVPRWNDLVGATGTCKVGVHEWDGRSGKMKSNDIRRFYEKGTNPVAPQAPAK